MLYKDYTYSLQVPSIKNGAWPDINGSIQINSLFTFISLLSCFICTVTVEIRFTFRAILVQ